jgi:L-threonylcarbamoyladenylate synthase
VIAHPITADQPEPAVIAQAADVLRRGGVVAYPTDTLYGLAVDPRNGGAVARLYAAKGRGQLSAIPLIAASLEQARGAAILDGPALQLARVFWPGPLTIVAPPERGLAAAVLGGGTTIAVRVPAHAVARALAAALGFCITATSANRSGELPAVTGADVAAAFASASDVDVLLDAGRVTGGPPSTIVEIGEHGPRLIRAGVVPWNRVLESLK